MAEKQSDSVVEHEKAQARPVFVLTRVEPIGSHFEAIKKLLDAWKDELKNFAACLEVDVICCVPEQVAWIERWESKASVDLFTREQLPFMPYTAAFFEHSRTVPVRHIYRKLA